MGRRGENHLLIFILHYYFCILHCDFCFYFVSYLTVSLPSIALFISTVNSIFVCLLSFNLLLFSFLYFLFFYLKYFTHPDTLFYSFQFAFLLFVIVMYYILFSFFNQTDDELIHPHYSICAFI